MKRWIAALAAFVALAARAAGIDDLAWMAGSWIHSRGGTDTEEQWLAPKGGPTTSG